MDYTRNSLKTLKQGQKKWISFFFNYILRTGRIYKLFKQGKVITIFKPGNDGTDASPFRPIFLLNVFFKLLDRMIIQRFQHLVDKVVPVSWAGFRQHSSCTEQIMALTSHI
jgi:hypothetical protein